MSLGFELEYVSRLPLGRLEVEDLRAVVHQRVGMMLSRPDARRLERISGGNPLYALELVRVAGRPGIRGGPLRPSDVEELIGDQLAQLPGRAAWAATGAAQASTTSEDGSGVVRGSGAGPWDVIR